MNYLNLIKILIKKHRLKNYIFWSGKYGYITKDETKLPYPYSINEFCICLYLIGKKLNSKEDQIIPWIIYYYQSWLLSFYKKINKWFLNNTIKQDVLYNGIKVTF